MIIINHNFYSFVSNTFARVDTSFVVVGVIFWRITRLSSQIFPCRLLFCAPTLIISNSIQLVFAWCYD